MPLSKGTLPRILVIVACVVAIVVSAFWIYSTQFKKPGINLALHREVGRVMAAETAKLVGTNKSKVVLIALDGPQFPEVKAQLKSFEEALRGTQITIKETYMLEAEGKAKYGVGAGLSARRYVRIVNKNVNADAIVSFVGAPDMDDDEIKQLKKTPPFVAECHGTDKLPKLFQKKILHVAVATRFTFPAPVEGKPRNPRQWFDKHFQVVTAGNAKALLGEQD